MCFLRKDNWKISEKKTKEKFGEQDKTDKTVEMRRSERKTWFQWLRQLMMTRPMFRTSFVFLFISKASVQLFWNLHWQMCATQVLYTYGHPLPNVFRLVRSLPFENFDNFFSFIFILNFFKYTHFVKCVDFNSVIFVETFFVFMHAQNIIA